MNIDLIHSFILGALYKLIDDFCDEEVLNTLFPNGKLICYMIIIFYTIYLFYFKHVSTNIYIMLFVAEIYYILTFLLKRWYKKTIDSIIFIEFSVYDPFFLLMLIKLPKFIHDFYYMCLTINYKNIIITTSIITLIAIFQDIEPSSLFGLVIFKNNNFAYKKEYKLIYRFLLTIFYTFLYNIYCPIEFVKYIYMITISYFLTSTISLFIQTDYEYNIKHKNFIENIEQIKIQLMH